MLLKNDFHLSYCSNIHPGENWAITLKGLKENLPKVKEKLAPQNEFGVGLRLSNLASEELSKEDNLQNFKTWLDENGLYVFTMNGFPYGNFHGERVKDMVHAPDWNTPERLTYTLRLFEQLAELLPEKMEGGISTSPISYKHWYQGDLEVQKAFEEGAANIAQVALRLYHIEQETGKYLHLDIEPEPDGLIENTQEAVTFFEDFLVPAAITFFGEEGFSVGEAEELVKKHITICYDVCHFALAYEEPAQTFEYLKNNNIRIGKIQISAALKIIGEENDISGLWEALAAFDEPTYLHQVTELIDGKIKTYKDLPAVLEERKDFKELRAHFHVPIFLEQFGLLQSTQEHIVKTLACLKKNPEITRHLEVETYTWEVLPKELKIPIVDSVVRELEWVKVRMT